MSLTLSSLPRLLQLCSPALPVGAYAYSQGLECAVDRGWVRDEASAGEWILGLLSHSVQRLDLPIFARLYCGWRDTDADAVRRWNARLYASREAAELQREDRHLGAALARLLVDLGLNEAVSWRNAPSVCFATLFSLAAVPVGIFGRTSASRRLAMSWSNLGICRGVAPSMGTFVERCTCPPSGPVKQAIQNRELGFRRRLDIFVTILNDNGSRCQACLNVSFY